MSLHGKSLYVLTPCYGGNLSVNYHNSFHQLAITIERLRQQQGVNIEFGAHNVYNESLVSRARNRLADSYLKETLYTHCVFIDADIGFEAHDILAMLDMDEDILGVPCSKKSLKWSRIQHAIARRAFEWAAQARPTGPTADDIAREFSISSAALPAEELGRIGGDFVLNYPIDESSKTFVMDKPESMRHVGTGLMMIKREVFEKFMKAYPDRWYRSRADAASNHGQIHDFFKVGINPETREYDSEDFWFCHDAIQIGFKVKLAWWVRTTHMGTATFHGDLPSALATAGTIF